MSHNISPKPLYLNTLLALLILGYQQPSYCGVYKWLDENGQIHYSDQPQDPGAEKFKLRSNTTTKPRAIANTEKEKAATDAVQDESNKDEIKQPDTPKMVEVEPSKQKKKMLCKQATNDIAAITSRGRMREMNTRGEYVFLSEEQRQQRLAAARKNQREFCR